MKSNALILLFALLFAVPGNALAGPIRGNPFYFSGAGSLVVTQDSDLGSTDPATDAVLRGASAQTEQDSGLGATAAAGLVFKRLWRLELEYGYRETDVDKVSAVQNGVKVELPVVGEFAMNTMMANVALDFRNASRFAPYLGAGIGLGLVEFSNPAFTTAGIPISAGSDDDAVFAYQLFGGVGYWVHPQVIGYAGYKYLGTGDARFTTTTATIDTHNFELGLRFYLSRP